MSALTCDLVAEFYKWSEPVARKEHECCECSAPILKGEKHFSCKGTWDGEFFHRRQHLLCMQACMFLRDNLNGSECIPFGCLKEAWDEIKWDCNDKREEPWKTLRSMLARILWRER